MQLVDSYGEACSAAHVSARSNQSVRWPDRHATITRRLDVNNVDVDIRIDISGIVGSVIAAFCGTAARSDRQSTKCLSNKRVPIGSDWRVFTLPITKLSRT